MTSLTVHTEIAIVCDCIVEGDVEEGVALLCQAYPDAIMIVEVQWYEVEPSKLRRI